MIKIKDLNINLKNFRLQDINLNLQENEFFVLMGPTGAGKTMLLEAMAGLIRLDSGKIIMDERDITTAPPEKRGVGIVYQDHALFPHLTVQDNIVYGFHFHRIEKSLAKKRFYDLVEILNIGHILERLPLHLSGGEKQRVALARALIVHPKVLLLDEPLSALDTNFREEIRIALKELQSSSKMTFFMVTHDFGEAMFLADNAAIINHGQIEQKGNTGDLFQRPISPFVAEFVGMKNVFPAAFQGSRAVFGGYEIDLGMEISKSNKYIAIRPEEILISPTPLPQNDYRALRGKVVNLIDNGFYFNVSVKTGDFIFQALLLKSAMPDINLTYGTQAYINLMPSKIHAF